MDTILDLFFNFDFMWEHRDEILAGFWITIKLSIVGGFFACLLYTSPSPRDS